MKQPIDMNSVYLLYEEITLMGVFVTLDDLLDGVRTLLDEKFDTFSDATDEWIEERCKELEANGQTSDGDIKYTIKTAELNTLIE